MVRATLVEHELEVTPRAAGAPAAARRSPRGKSRGRGGSASPPTAPRTVCRRATPWRCRRRTSAEMPQLGQRLEALEHQFDLPAQAIPLQHVRGGKGRVGKGRQDDHVLGEPQRVAGGACTTACGLPSLACDFFKLTGTEGPGFGENRWRSSRRSAPATMCWPTGRLFDGPGHSPPWSTTGGPRPDCACPTTRVAASWSHDGPAAVRQLLAARWVGHAQSAAPSASGDHVSRCPGRSNSRGPAGT